MTETATAVSAVADAATESGELPEGWALAGLTEVCALNPAKPAKDAIAGHTPVAFVPMPAVDAESGLILTPSVRPFGEVRKGFTAFRDGDVIFAKITPCMENGKSAIARGLTNGLGFGSTEFHVLRPTPAVLAEYVHYFVRQESFRRAAAEEMTGSVGQRRVPASYLENVSIPLPPLVEQKRIVAEIERLLAEVNKAREHLDRVPKILKRFRQSILAAACSGQLTADWRNTHQGKLSGDYSLERILNERQEVWEVKRNDRYKAPAEPDDEDVGELPDGWIRASVDQLTTNITSGSRDWSQYYGSGSGTFIMAQNVRPGRLDLTTRQPVDPPATSPDRARSQVERGDLLVTIVGANTGDVCVVESELPEHYVCQSVALIRPTELGVAPYLGLYLNSPMHGQAVYHRYMYGEGRPHLSFDQLKRTPVHLPTPEEQAEIVRRAKRLLALADEIELELGAASRKVQAVPQAILASAFRGELVPTEAELARTENRTYESATQLLARISKGTDRDPQPNSNPTARKQVRRKR